MGCVGCGGYEVAEPIPVADLASIQQASVSCDSWTDTGYKDGTPFAITLVTIDGKPAEVNTANAYVVMQEAAAAAGVDIRVVSGFRTYAQQEYLYGCYIHCNCNNCNQAAPPGYSEHQSGHALDLNTSTGSVLTWLNSHGASFGFTRTVPGEAWHWEWWGGGPGGGPCNGGNAATACTLTTTGEVGVCMDTGACAALGGSHVSSPGYCPGPSNIQCCTGSTPCTLDTGVSGECLFTAECTALGGSHVSTSGYCPGGSDYKCCTGSTPCTLDTGVTGECLEPAACAALGDHVSTPGSCPGPSDIQCCTPTAPPAGADASTPEPDAAQAPDAGGSDPDAALPGPDAGDDADAGAVPGADAASGDAGASGPPGTVTSGCGCGASAGATSPWWLAVLLLAATRRAAPGGRRA